MDVDVRQALQTILVALLFVLLFLVLMPPLMSALSEPWGRALYGLLAFVAVVVAFRLRSIARRL